MWEPQDPTSVCSDVTPGTLVPYLVIKLSAVRLRMKRELHVP